MGRSVRFVDRRPYELRKDSQQHFITMMATLTKEQKEIIETKRQVALQRRNERQRLQSQHSSCTNTNSSSSKSLNARGGLPASHSQQVSSNTSCIKDNSFGVKPSSKQKHDFRQFVHHKNTSLSTGEVVTGNCQLISKERFTVTVPYHEQLIDIFNSIDSRNYDPAEKTWNFTLEDYNIFMRKLQCLKGAVSVTGLPDYVLKTFRKSSHEPENFKDVDLSRIDVTLLNSLMPFQREGICFGISKNGRFLLADDMGLGKTIQSLGVAHYYKDDWPLLIVTPSSVRYLWADAIMTWLPSVPYHNVMVMTSSTDYVKEAQILITSYDLMTRQQRELKEMDFGVCIMDESHFLKSTKSARTQAAGNLLESAKRVIMLSGTPALSRPVELYPQISAIQPKLFPRYFEFGVRYCAGVKNSFGWDFKGSSNMKELKLILENHLMIRRLKSDVISQLPPKVRQMVILNPEVIDVKSKEMKQCVKTLDQQHLTGIERRGALLSYYCATGKAKLKAIQDYIGDMLDSEKKFICFAHHRVVIDGICEVISGKKKEFIRIDGRTDSNTRKLLCDNFQFEDKYVAAVLSITAANAGITLTAAHLVVFAEMYWNPGILTQAEDRAHRIGQDDSVLIQYLVAKGTADDHLWPLIQGKLDVLNKAGLSKDNFLDTETTVVKNSRKQPSILNYFSDMCSLDNELTNDMLAGIDFEQFESFEKRPKLN
ncbi:SWI/SNF-related matrix-associated actin-dependent regulator of chromatin subfamily A-like protein 1 isoform X2 [Zootermopsis nevadensis]|uniref:SWI/SNF-related matrix-associated actin-dependent regulator of chromatin subfamily A-like protein 1 isoform X2 n=1 Tax=Zootermopsis nevadensis TaxID=136037 RepID=UPI000B8EB0A2|nr:SWI/SNF-related matrix-associated actin-dependent regulator of chromatin subfamily A-like protein 1 isoform X2 [Zootermopsis nevadensis]